MLCINENDPTNSSNKRTSRMCHVASFSWTGNLVNVFWAKFYPEHGELTSRGKAMSQTKQKDSRDSGKCPFDATAAASECLPSSFVTCLSGLQPVFKIHLSSNPFSTSAKSFRWREYLLFVLFEEFLMLPLIWIWLVWTFQQSHNFYLTREI